MKSLLDPGAGAALTGLFVGSLAIAGAVALVTAPITPRVVAARHDGVSGPPTTRSISPVTPDAAAAEQPVPND